MNRYYINLLFVFSLIFIFLDLNAQQRWTISDNGGIDWTVGNQDSHSDHIEMSGKQISVVLRYGVTKEGCFIINKSLVFPLLRTIPNDTHASLMRRTDWNLLDRVTVNGCSLQNEKVEHLFLRGMLIVKSAFATTTGKVEVMRTYFPSTEKPALIEKYEIKNLDTDDIKIKIPESESVITTDVGKGVDGSYKIKMQANKTGSYKLPVGKSIVFYASIAGYKEGQSDLNINGEDELNKRIKFIDYLTDNLVLETPNKIINRMFAFSKIRSCESIYETKNGPMHGPGGESYYAAIWANDQAEYINPYFPFIGYKYGNLSAFNSYRLFAKYMNEDWSPMPSSIIAEGTNIWNGAGDRGDAAMIAYGAARYALAYGNKKEALALWPLIKWCLEYCYRQLNDQGVVASDSDELEGRFPAGKANLCTSSLYYDALLSAAYLNKSLNGSPKLSGLYRKQAIALRENIENYFGGNVEGFDTYKYYEGNEVLRSWICMPLTVGIKDRALETIKALFSPYLCTKMVCLRKREVKPFGIVRLFMLYEELILQGQLKRRQLI